MKIYPPDHSFAFDEHRVEATLEEVAVEPVPPVEELGIDAIEALHSLREVRRRRFEEEVVVVAGAGSSRGSPS